MFKVVADGCRLVTEKSLYHLVKNCPNLKEISLIGTGVTSVPAEVRKSKVKLYLQGCPLLHPPGEEKQGIETEINIVQILGVAADVFQEANLCLGGG